MASTQFPLPPKYVQTLQLGLLFVAVAVALAGVAAASKAAAAFGGGLKKSAAANGTPPPMGASIIFSVAGKELQGKAGWER